MRLALGKCFPPNLSFLTGEVIDSRGHRSRQTDIVAVSQHHPGQLSTELPNLFLVEGVRDAGEVKSVLTSVELDKALKASQEFKRLRVRYQVGSTIRGDPNPADNRYVRCPPYFIVALESRLTLETIGTRVLAHQQRHGLASGELVDSIFILSRGWVIDFGEGDEKVL